jgi:hypothetical protein
LQFLVGKFVSELIFAVLLRVLLNCIIGQVDEGIGEILQGEGLATGSDITF